jgi:hypothetical protein
MFECFLTRILQNKAMRKVSRPHVGKYIPLNAAHRIGFIVNAENPGSSQAVSIIEKELQKLNIEYHGICVDMRKKKSGESGITPSPALCMIQRKDINWYGLPHENRISGFLQKPYDILIDLTQDKRIFAADYILASTEASFRISISAINSSPCDMTVSSGDGPGTESPDILLKNILIYLTTIHTDSK